MRGQIQLIVFIDKIESKEEEDNDLLVELGGRKLTEDEKKRKLKTRERRSRNASKLSGSPMESMRTARVSDGSTLLVRTPLC